MPSGKETADFLYAHWYSGWQSYGCENQPRFVNPVQLIHAYEAINREFSYAAIRHGLATSALSIVPKGWVDAERGYWSVSTQPEDNSVNPQKSLRLYWNAPAEAAPFVLSTLQHALFQSQTSYQIKLPLAYHDFNRYDSCVLYLPMEAYELTRPFLLYGYKILAPYLRPQTPALARPLAPGLALAESPHSGESFGSHRCGLIAKGLSMSSRSDPLPIQMDNIMNQFMLAGISVSTPHLNSIKTDYPW
jgi:hypothetical protein